MFPREKALNFGINTLNNVELLSLIIKSGYKDKDVFDLANDILEKANGFNNLLTLNLEELTQIKGIKNAKALEILAILEIAKRLNNIESVNEEEMNNPKKVVDYLRMNIGFSNVEEFLVIFLSGSGNVIKSEIMFKGSRNASIVGIDEIFRKAILLKSAGIVVCHNHPSGKVEPSSADIQITRDLKKSAEMLNIKLFDHIIVSKSSYYSFKQENLI